MFASKWGLSLVKLNVAKTRMNGLNLNGASKFAKNVVNE